MRSSQEGHGGNSGRKQWIALPSPFCTSHAYPSPENKVHCVCRLFHHSTCRKSLKEVEIPRLNSAHRRSPPLCFLIHHKSLFPRIFFSAYFTPPKLVGNTVSSHQDIVAFSLIPFYFPSTYPFNRPEQIAERLNRVTTPLLDPLIVLQSFGAGRLVNSHWPL